MSTSDLIVRTVFRTPEGTFLGAGEMRPERLSAQPHYVDGAIILTVGGRPILTEAEWDMVDHLWWYIIDGLPKLRQAGEWSTGFPDQALTLRLRLTGQECLVTVEHDGILRQATCSADALITSLLTAAQQAMAALAILQPARAELFRQGAGEAAAHLLEIGKPT